MSSVKVAITIDRETLIRVDALVSKSIFPNRSRAIQAAVSEKLARMERGRLASKCAPVAAEDSLHCGRGIRRV
jgi:metal-responsive CopG/Arc/MetJ family transcriptional regulator